MERTSCISFAELAFQDQPADELDQDGSKIHKGNWDGTKRYQKQLRRLLTTLTVPPQRQWPNSLFSPERYMLHRWDSAGIGKSMEKHTPHRPRKLHDI